MRRFLWSFLISALVASSAISATGASSEDIDTGVHASYDVLIRDGDRWRPPSSKDAVPEHWEWWQASDVVLDSTGRPVATSAFHQAFWIPGKNDTESAVTYVSARGVVRQDTTTFGPVSHFRSDVGGSYGGLSTNLGFGPRTSDQTVRATSFGQGTLPCGSSMVVQEEDLQITGSCEEWPNGPSEILDLQRGADERVGELSARLYWSPRVAVWIADGFPVPVRIETGSVRLDLVGLAVVKTQASQAPFQEERTHWELSSLQPWGLDETGVEGPFTPRDAYEAALWLPAAPSLGAFMLAHPQAVPFLVQGEVAETGDRTVRTWRFVIADEEAVWSGNISRETRGHASYVGAGGGVLERVSFPLPPLEKVPRSVPDVRSLADRWALLANQHADDANLWGYAITCADAACTKAESSFAVGNERWTFPSQLPISVQQAGGNISRATFSADGQAKSLVSTDYRSGTSFAGLGDRPESLRPHAMAPRLDGFGAPGVTVLAGLALLGAIAAAASRLVPFLLALYARIRTDSLPEHPTRATIIDLVTANPGIRYSDLLAELGCGMGTLTHHLAHLERGGHVVRVKRNGLACYFRTQQAGASDAQAWLRSTTARRILGLLAERPRSTGAVYRLAGCSRSNAHRHLVRIEKAGLIRRQGRRAELTEAGRDAWQTVRGSSLPA